MKKIQIEWDWVSDTTHPKHVSHGTSKRFDEDSMTPLDKAKDVFERHYELVQDSDIALGTAMLEVEAIIRVLYADFYDINNNLYDFYLDTYTVLDNMSKEKDCGI